MNEYCENDIKIEPNLSFITYYYDITDIFLVIILLLKKFEKFD